jgi:hypothetical protein
MARASQAELDDLRATGAGWLFYSQLRLGLSHASALAHILTYRVYAANWKAAQRLLPINTGDD